MPLLGALLAAPVEDPELAEGRNAPHRSVFLFPSVRVWTVRICFILSTTANGPDISARDLAPQAHDPLAGLLT
jgi:hypothetical protein